MCPSKLDSWDSLILTSSALLPAPKWVKTRSNSRQNSFPSTPWTCVLVSIWYWLLPNPNYFTCSSQSWVSKSTMRYFLRSCVAVMVNSQVLGYLSLLLSIPISNHRTINVFPHPISDKDLNVVLEDVGEGGRNFLYHSVVWLHHYRSGHSVNFSQNSFPWPS